MRYRVTFRKRFNQEGQGADDPPSFVNVSDGVILDAAFVERFEPDALHSEERMEEDDDFLSIGTEIWEYEVADGRDQEFKDALVNSEMVIEFEDAEGEPTLPDSDSE